MSASPLHLAAGYAAIANGGTRVQPTLLKQDGPQYWAARDVRTGRQRPRAICCARWSPKAPRSFGEVPGYAVGGKTGTADKPKERGGGYYEDKVIATFASDLSGA